MDEELTMLHHDGQELDNDLAGWADEDLTLAAAFSVDNGVQSVVQNTDADHLGIYSSSGSML